MITLGIIFVIIASLLWAFRPYMEEYEEGEWILWYSFPFSRTNRKYLRL